MGSSSNEDSLSLLSIRIKLTSCHLVFISPSVSTCMQSPCPPYCPLCLLSLCLYISLVLSIRQNNKLTALAMIHLGIFVYHRGCEGCQSKIASVSHECLSSSHTSYTLDLKCACSQSNSCS